MMRRHHRALGVVLVVVGASSAGLGCQSVRMQVPESLQSAQVLPVSGGGASGALVDEELAFGGYRVHHVDREFTTTESRGSSLGRGSSGASRSKTQSGVSFVMASPGGQWRGVCDGRMTQTDVSIGALSFTPSQGGHFHCVCAHQSGPGRAELWLGESRANVVMGELELSVRATGAYITEDGAVGDSGGVTGFVLNGPPGDLAAVDVTSPGAVYLGQPLAAADRDAVACVAAALLLGEP